MILRAFFVYCIRIETLKTLYHDKRPKDGFDSRALGLCCFYTVMKININPEFKALIPPLSSEEFAQLEANILEEGIRDDIVTWQGVIVDGHNRYAIATKHDCLRMAVDRSDLQAASGTEYSNTVLDNGFWHAEMLKTIPRLLRGTRRHLNPGI